MCASEMIEHRKNSWELYGFDFMVDDDYNAWLIEINSSPACDYSTKVTEVYVQKALVTLPSFGFIISHVCMHVYVVPTVSILLCIGGNSVSGIRLQGLGATREEGQGSWA